MINFDEELKKFHPSQEVEDAEEFIRNHDTSDLVDLLMSMINAQNTIPKNRQV